MKTIFFFLVLLYSYIDAKPYQELFKPHNEEPRSSIDGIDGIYVINLDHRPENWHRLEPILHYNNIEASRFSAVFGSDFDIHTARTFCAKYLGPGQLGCMLSHLSVYHDGLKRGLKTIWVMEDDVQIDRDPHVITGLIEKLTAVDPEWDILYTDLDATIWRGRLDAPEEVCITVRSEALPLDKELPYELDYYTYRKDVTGEIRLIRSRYGTYSMIVSDRGMKKLIDHFTTGEDILWPYDIEIHYTPNLRQYAIIDSVARHAYFSFNFSDTGVSWNRARGLYEIDNGHKTHMFERAELYEEIKSSWLDFVCEEATIPF
jgi:GR25 family glycosyltransferase involved in LPS biosynthesis